MTAVAAPYTLLRRDGQASLSSAEMPAERRAGLLRADVERLIAERCFSLAFQPIVRLSNRLPVAHEALLRLRPPPGLPTLPTRAFATIAAEFGLAATLDTAVLDAALTAASRANCGPVSVNLSAHSLASRAFLANAAGRIRGDGALLIVEVIDAPDADDFAELAAGVEVLQRRGVRVALDDFCGDEAALACLRRVRFDWVKLSGDVLQAASRGERGRRLVRALLALARATGAETAAKMIETLPQAWLMEDLGVTLGQGWRFGAPGRLSRSADTGRPAKAA